MNGDILFVIGAYIIGALPHLHLLGRLRGFHLEGDLHMELWSKGGRPLGTIGFLGDLAKGTVVILIGKSLDLDVAVIVFGGLVVVSGINTTPASTETLSACFICGQRACMLLTCRFTIRAVYHGDSEVTKLLIN